MNFEEKILNMERAFAKESSRDACENVGDLSLTFIFKFQVFEPCRYISEDEDWITFLIVPPDENFESQIMSLRKDEIVSFGILNEKNLAEFSAISQEIEPESLYQ